MIPALTVGQPPASPTPPWAGPATQQIPDAQAEIFWNEQPEADEVAGDLIGQQLAYTAFQTDRIARFLSVAATSAIALNKLSVGTKRVEFFFVGRRLQ